MNPVLDKDALKALVKKYVVKVTGDNVEFPVRYDREPQEFIFGNTEFVLHVSSFSGLGTDEFVTNFDEPSDTISTEQRSNRLFTLSIRCDSDGAIDSYEVIERLRTRLSRESFRAALNALGIAMVHVEPAVEVINAVWDNRVISSSNVDCKMALAYSDVDDDPVHGGSYIATVNGSNMPYVPKDP